MIRPPHLRRDATTASRVDLVLILLPHIGLPAAARSALENGVPLEVAVRVLTRPAARRRHVAPDPAMAGS